VAMISDNRPNNPFPEGVDNGSYRQLSTMIHVTVENRPRLGGSK
jgi:hypothetical protein